MTKLSLLFALSVAVSSHDAAAAMLTVAAFGALCELGKLL